MNINSTQLIDKLIKCIKGDDGIIIDGHAKKRFNRLHCKSRTSTGDIVRNPQWISCIYTAVLKTGDTNPQIAGDIKHSCSDGCGIVLNSQAWYLSNIE